MLSLLCLFHDIANPLTAASLSLNQIAGSKYINEDPYLKQSVSILGSSLTSIKDYLLDARIKLNNHDLKKDFVLKDIICETYFLFHHKCELKKIILENKVNSKISILGDRVKFKRILSNLIANAIDAYDQKVTNSKKMVLIEFKTTDSALEIMIKDWGLGINGQNINKIFHPFFTTKGKKGTGLGLAIVKEIIEDYFEGGITCQSAYKKGTIFILSIPFHRFKIFS
jgi:signal transduction histidine kinase